MRRCPRVPQTPKLGGGETESITTFWEDLTVVQLPLYPLTVALVGVADANVGLMRAAGQQLVSVLEPVRAKAAELAGEGAGDEDEA